MQTVLKIVPLYGGHHLSGKLSESLEKTEPYLPPPTPKRKYLSLFMRSMVIGLGMGPFLVRGRGQSFYVIIINGEVLGTRLELVETGLEDPVAFIRCPVPPKHSNG